MLENLSFSLGELILGRLDEIFQVLLLAASVSLRKSTGLAASWTTNSQFCSTALPLLTSNLEHPGNIVISGRNIVVLQVCRSYFRTLSSGVGPSIHETDPLFRPRFAALVTE